MLSIAIAISSVAFSQTTKSKIQNLKIEKKLLKEDPNNKECSTCPKANKKVSTEPTNNKAEKPSRKIEGVVTQIPKAKTETKK